MADPPTPCSMQASLPYLYIKYVQEGQDYISDAEEVVKKITKQLPGLDK